MRNGDINRWKLGEDLIRGEKGFVLVRFGRKASIVVGIGCVVLPLVLFFRFEYMGPILTSKESNRSSSSMC